MSPTPRLGDIVVGRDAVGRVLRVSAHPSSDRVVVSIWQDGRCLATLRLAGDDVPALVRALTAATDLLRRDTPVPDARIPDARIPDSTISDSTIPDSTIPDSTIPDFAEASQAAPVQVPVARATLELLIEPPVTGQFQRPG